VVCELDKTVGKTCVLRSPLITLNWTCAIVRYELSSDDVKLTAELLEDGVSKVNYTVLADNRMKTIPKEDLGSSIRLQLTASRYLVSSDDYEFARVTSVHFYDWCGAVVKKGMCENVNCSWQTLTNKNCT